MTPAPALPQTVSIARPRRALAVLGLGLLVLMLHGWLLGTLPPLPGHGGRGDAPRMLRVRQITLPAAPVAVAAAEPAPAAPAAALPATRATRPAAAASAAPVAAAPPSAAKADTGGEPLPVYATLLPPAATLQYAVQREGAGRAGVQAELRWRPAEGRYTLTLGVAAAGWASVGEIDAHGLAPERHVETRRGREVRAVNFQRDRGRITFSGPQVEYPLLPGAQDRLSWLLQLPAVLAANPALAEAGQQLQLFVAGSRGDASVWTFTSLGVEALDLPAGRVDAALHFRREADRPYDTRVDVWLDPARHHLPVRVRLPARTEGEAAEFLLQALTLP